MKRMRSNERDDIFSAPFETISREAGLNTDDVCIALNSLIECGILFPVPLSQEEKFGFSNTLLSFLT